MRKIFRQNWGWLALSLLVVGVSIYKVSTFKNGFTTMFDEGYFLLKLQEAYELSHITGKSQWNLIAVQWFPFMDLTSKVNSSYATWILQWLQIIAITATCCVLFCKERILKYFAITSLVCFPGGGWLFYIPMHSTVLCMALCAFMCFWHVRTLRIKQTSLVLCGFFLGIDCFIIITGAMVLIPLFLLMIIMHALRNNLNLTSTLFPFFIGVVLSICYIHFFVCSFYDIVEAMRFTASYISKSGHNYDLLSFIHLYLAFFRQLFYVSVSAIGAYWLSSIFDVYNKWIQISVYIVSLVLVLYITSAPNPHTIYVLLFSIVLIPGLSSIKNKLVKGKNRIKLSERSALFLFLSLFAILAPLGTNCAIETRLPAYVYSWLFIYFLYERYSNRWRWLILPMILFMMIPQWRFVRDYDRNKNEYFFTSGNPYFKDVAITQKQKEYFDGVWSIISQYGYKPHKSVVFTAMYDYGTLYAIDAVNSTNFYHIENFAYFDKSQMLAPDFVILCPQDSTIIEEDLKKMPWGWPEDFDVYEIGTPEAKGTNDMMENRKLYCRRSLKLS